MERMIRKGGGCWDGTRTYVIFVAVLFYLIPKKNGEGGLEDGPGNPRRAIRT